MFLRWARPVVWGARTIAPRKVAPWGYVHVRRLAVFVEESIAKAVRWAVFEPNDAALWKNLKRIIAEFQMPLWCSGRAARNTPQQVFFVRIDEVVNPAPVGGLRASQNRKGYRAC